MEKYPADFEIYLNPTPFIDFDSKEVRSFVNEVINPNKSQFDNLISLYYEVRDRFSYNPYKVSLTVKGFKASAVIKNGYGFCIPKAVLLAASARAIGIPARLGYVDVKNHLSSEKLTKYFGDIFVYHSYADIFLNGKWVKATPAFNASLCDMFNVAPLDFDGKQDSLFQQFNKEGKKYMEYIKDRGVFHEIPFDNNVKKFKEIVKKAAAKSKTDIAGDFGEDALKERKANENIIVYTDGACSGNPGAGGYGAVIKEGDKIREIFAGYRRTTNNRMELLACIEALSLFKDKKTITLYSDSKYVVDGITKGWAKRWESNNWMRNKEEPALNADLWKRLLDLCKKHKVSFKWVKGHAGSVENERCDKLAVNAAKEDDLLIDYAYENK